MFKTISFIALLPLLSYGEDAYILIENTMVRGLGPSLQSLSKKKQISPEHSLVRMDSKNIHFLSHAIHQKFHRCGGFFYFESEADAQEYARQISLVKKAPAKDYFLFRNKNITNINPLIEKAVAEVQEINIRKTIEKLSSYKTRYYQHETGVTSAKWIASKWQELVSHRDDARVILYEHASWKQPSVILEIKGQSKDAIVLGGHLDSITFSGAAPGADDNASGIATITEIIRVFVDEGVRPEKTLLFMGYAAEEVGLRGSKEIAKKIVSEGKYNVVGALQFDMTNFKGSDKTIYLINDNTSENLSKYLGTLIDRYVNVSWGYTACGYACSDHASWHNEGIPAAFPFEANFSEYNRRIHTANDKLDVSGGHAEHAVNFAKLGVAFVLDL